MMFGQSRIIFAMARDGLIPKRFAAVHPIFRTPALSTGVLGLLIALTAAMTPINFVGSLANMGTLAAFILVSISLPILRKRYPDTKGFSVPFGPYVIPTLSAITAFCLMIYLRVGSPTVPKVDLTLPGIGSVTVLPALPVPIPWFGFIVWLLIGFVIYFLYGRAHSTVGIDETAEKLKI